MIATNYKSSLDRPTLSNALFTNISKYIYQNYGIKLDDSKKMLVETRLVNRLSTLGFSSFNDYFNYALNQSNVHERNFVRDSLTTNKTDFFREIEHFRFLQKEAVPTLNKSSLKVWSAASSSGEEAYTIAMVLDDMARQLGFNFSVMGSDISEKVLQKAKGGVYRESDVRVVPSLYKAKYLLRSKSDLSDRVKICPDLRSKVEFRYFNLMEKHYNHGKYDVIFCRNVLIYFDFATQYEVIRKLESSLAPGGYLFIGHSESIIGMKTRLKRIKPTIYQLPLNEKD